LSHRQQLCSYSTSSSSRLTIDDGLHGSGHDTVA
jgi:hypothetical protein